MDTEQMFFKYAKIGNINPLMDRESFAKAIKEIDRSNSAGQIDCQVGVKLAEEQIMRKIGGALKSTMDRHGGVINRNLINSATKRIYGELYKNQDSKFTA